MKNLKSSFFYESDSPDRIDIKCQIENNSYASNSFAAPIITAKVCDYINNGVRTMAQIKNKLQMEYALVRNTKQIYRAVLLISAKKIL